MLPTAAQILARDRNWKIRDLRGIWHKAGKLFSAEITISMVRAHVDCELQKLGAETEISRYTKRRAAIARGE